MPGLDPGRAPAAHTRLPSRGSGRPRVAALLCALAAAVALTGSAGCDQGSGYVHGDLLVVSGCEVADVPRTFLPFEMSLLFLGQMRHEEWVLMRASSSAMLQGDADEIMIELGEVIEIQQTLQAGLGPVVLDVGPEAPVGIGLALNRRCEVVVDALVGVNGTVTFEHLGTRAGDRVAASFEMDMMDLRTGQIVGYGFRGQLDFSVEVNLPYQNFVDLGSRIGE